jgi:hypothetical protein
VTISSLLYDNVILDGNSYTLCKFYYLDSNLEKFENENFYIFSKLNLGNFKYHVKHENLKLFFYFQ